LNGFIIPALRTRRARTGIELRDGQSFALAGLLDNSESTTYTKVPGLGNLPVIGNLFRSKDFQRNESELMFIVTTQIVHPINRGDLPALPAVESLKKGSLLGVQQTVTPPKQSSENNGNSGGGYITEPAPAKDKTAPVTAPTTTTPAKPASPTSSAPATKTDGSPTKTQTSNDAGPAAQEAKSNPDKP